ncbi:MAG: PglZ domain-containing protein [Dehalobacter sp.]|nr:PglZ domain-containing protein [Dehalobacter sp.]
MNWVKRVVNPLISDLGGLPTFCDDPDDLLEQPEVREALRSAGMSVYEWDGLEDELSRWTKVPEDEKPIIIAPSLPRSRALVQSKLKDYRWESVSIGRLFPRLVRDIVLAVPRSRWDVLLRLHEVTPRSLSARDTAWEIARALYGVDPLFLKTSEAWNGLLARIVVGNEGLPRQIASWFVPIAVSSGRKDISEHELTDPVAARTLLLSQSNTSVAPSWETFLVDCAKRPAVISRLEVVEDGTSWQESPDSKATPREWLNYAWTYAESCNTKSNQALRSDTNAQFVNWVQNGGYNLALSATNPEVLCISSLRNRLADEAGSDRMIVFMVDCLSLRTWLVIEKTWNEEGVFSQFFRRAAFTVIPTITSLARRAFFEGILPNRFSASNHSARLERTLWRYRFRDDGEWFQVTESSGIRDAIAKGKSRICILDASWDSIVHSLQLSYDSTYAAAKRWARRTPLRGLLREGLDNGYRLWVLSDHGHVECRGIGRPYIGELAEKASQRVLLFPNDSLRKANCIDGTFIFQPTGLPADCQPLFAAESGAFASYGTTIESHGGFSIEEAIIPVVEVLA